MWKHPMHCAYAVVAVVALGACASTPVQPGVSRGEVIARMGQPSRVLPLDGGTTRLQYSRQPAGRQVFNVDLDASDRVVQVRQMLVAEEFARIVLDQWTREDVERAFGPPASIDRVASWPDDIMTYRWSDGEDMFYWVYLDRNNVVRRTGQGVEYHHDD